MTWHFSYVICTESIRRQAREAEMVQGVHRARLFRIADAQTGMFEAGEETIARSVSTRQWVRVVIHSTQPVPGLRVDQLVGVLGLRVVRPAAGVVTV